MNKKALVFSQNIEPLVKYNLPFNRKPHTLKVINSTLALREGIGTEYASKFKAHILIL